MFLKGMKLIDIARQLELPEGTVRRWKSTHKWESECSDKKQTFGNGKKVGSLAIRTPHGRLEINMQRSMDSFQSISQRKLVISFLVAIAAGVACHYIIKWLDRDHKDNEYPSGYFATIKEKKNPSTVRHYGRGISFFVHMERYNFLPTGIIAYANLGCKMHF